MTMPRGKAGDAAASIESEVRANVLGQAVGPVTLGELETSGEFISRVVDRVIRVSYFERHRIVVDDGRIIAAASQEDSRRSGALQEPGRSASVDDRPGGRTDASKLGWSTFGERPPALASFRSPATDGVEVARRLFDPSVGSGLDESVGVRLRNVRIGLARDGLLSTLVRVLLESKIATGAAGLKQLAEIGLPVDLLDWFEVDGVRGVGIVTLMQEKLNSGSTSEQLNKQLRRAKFVAWPTLAGFRPSSDSGADEPLLLRLHLLRTSHFVGEGDGGCLDLVLGVLRATPDIDAIVVTEAIQKADVERKLADIGPSGRSIRVVPQMIRPSQWAGDNAKGGRSNDGREPDRPAHLGSRFASRREEVSVFMGGDDLALHSAAEAGVVSARSPLIFEGGNLLVCDDLAKKERVLLIGEGEIQRQRLLGLTVEQALDAFRAEFQVDRCVVLPAASYHIDQEVSVRSVPGGRTIALVPDVHAAVRLVLRAGLERMGSIGRWPESLTRGAAEFLDSGRVREALTLIWTALRRESEAGGGWPASFAEGWSLGSVDSGVGNLQRFLLATDLLAAEAARTDEFPDAHFQAVLRSFARRASDRRSIRSKLAALGWQVHAVPAIPEDARGINPLNGVHLRRRYIMPSYGGVFSNVDSAARHGLNQALGADVEVVLAPSGESQRREGAVHCSIGLGG